MLNTFIQSSENREEAKRVMLWSIENAKKNGLVPPKNTSSTSESGGGCYIATAIYGSYNSSEVMVLRRFRDEVLINHWWGRVFVKLYYAVSPSVADKLKNANRINLIVRRQLDVFVNYLREEQYKY